MRHTFQIENAEIPKRKAPTLPFLEGSLASRDASQDDVGISVLLPAPPLAGQQVLGLALHPPESSALLCVQTRHMQSVQSSANFVPRWHQHLFDLWQCEAQFGHLVLASKLQEYIPMNFCKKLHRGWVWKCSRGKMLWKHVGKTISLAALQKVWPSHWSNQQ